MPRKSGFKIKKTNDQGRKRKKPVKKPRTKNEKSEEGKSDADGSPPEKRNRFKSWWKNRVIPEKPSQKLRERNGRVR